MPPSLRVSVGASLDSLQLISPNSERTCTVSTPLFQGRATVRIRNFHGVVPEGEERKPDTSYFDEGSHAKGCTWSISFQGRLRKTVSANDLVWGNQFEKPIRDKLPYGMSIALRAVHIIDPTLKEDLYADKPWAFSPLAATMTRINVKRLAKDPGFASAEEAFQSPDWPAFPHGAGFGQPAEVAYVKDDISALLLKPRSTGVGGGGGGAAGNGAEDGQGGDGGGGAGLELVDDVEAEGVADLSTVTDLRGSRATSERARFFGDENKRQLVHFTPNDIITTSWDLGFVDFNDLSVSLPYTGMKFHLSSYWDGQPVTYFLKDQSTKDVFLVVQLNIVELDA